MSFYGNSFFEFKEFFKRFVFQNKDGEQFVFDPVDLFDQLKQKAGNRWIKFSKDQEHIEGAKDSDVVVISHAEPDAANAEPGGLMKLDDGTEIPEDSVILFKPGEIAAILDFDYDEMGHIVAKGNKYFTFPNATIGFRNKDGELIKVSATDNENGDFIYFSGNGYVDFSFDPATGALNINHVEAEAADVERLPAGPVYHEERPEDVEIQSFRSGSVLQVPNFYYDKYGHIVKDKENPYNYYSLDMADSYIIENFSTTIGDNGWQLYEGYADLYYKEIPALTAKVYGEETIFNAACDQVTRLMLVDKGLAEFWVDNEKKKAIMYIRGDLSAFAGDTTQYAFQAQIINSYQDAQLPLGINGTVIVFLSDITPDGTTPNLYTGISSHKFSEIKYYLENGKTVLCLNKENNEYYVPYQMLDDHIDFVKTNNDENRITSIKVSIYEDQGFLRELVFDTSSLRSVFISNDSGITAGEIYNIVQVGQNVFYTPPGTNQLIPLSFYSPTDGAVFSHTTVQSGVINIQMYTIDAAGNVTPATYTVNTSNLLPTGGAAGQILQINESGVPVWTTPFVKIDTADDNRILYYNSTTNEYEPVSASWA